MIGNGVAPVAAGKKRGRIKFIIDRLCNYIVKCVQYNRKNV